MYAYLHSNMDRLKLAPVAIPDYAVVIYIPIWMD